MNNTGTCWELKQTWRSRLCEPRVNHRACSGSLLLFHCPACRTYVIARRSWDVVISPFTYAWLYMSFLLFCLIFVYSSQDSFLFWIMYLSNDRVPVDFIRTRELSIGSWWALLTLSKVYLAGAEIYNEPKQGSDRFLLILRLWMTCTENLHKRCPYRSDWRFEISLAIRCLETEYL